MGNRIKVTIELGIHGNHCHVYDAYTMDEFTDVTDMYIHAQACQPLKGHFLQYVLDEEGNAIRTRRGYKKRKVFFVVEELWENTG